MEPNYVSQVCFIEIKPCSFIYVFSTVAFLVKQQSVVVKTETLCPSKFKILTVWIFTEKVCRFLM